MNTTAFETIEFQTRDNVAIIRLNRPDRLNSFNATMFSELSVALRQIASNTSLRGLIITGNGRAFCTGQDLKERQHEDGEPYDLTKSLKENYKPLIMGIQGLTIPVISVVNGYAAGAGMSLALCADIVYATECAKFLQAFARIGLVPDAGSSHFMVQNAGLQNAMAMAMLAEDITAAEAQRMNLVYKCIGDEAVEETITELCSRLNTLAPCALKAIKQIMRQACSNTLSQQMDLETEYQGKMGTTADYQEGVQAFVEKRPPKFTGQ